MNGFKLYSNDVTLLQTVFNALKARFEQLGHEAAEVKRPDLAWNKAKAEAGKVVGLRFNGKSLGSFCCSSPVDTSEWTDSCYLTVDSPSDFIALALNSLAEVNLFKNKYICDLQGEVEGAVRVNLVRMAGAWHVMFSRSGKLQLCMPYAKLKEILAVWLTSDDKDISAVVEPEEELAQAYRYDVPDEGDPALYNILGFCMKLGYVNEPHSVQPPRGNGVCFAYGKTPLNSDKHTAPLSPNTVCVFVSGSKLGKSTNIQVCTSAAEFLLKAREHAKKEAVSPEIGTDSQPTDFGYSQIVFDLGVVRLFAADLESPSLTLSKEQLLRLLDTFGPMVRDKVDVDTPRALEEA